MLPPLGGDEDSALVVPGGFERPDGPEPPRKIPALHALVLRLTREHEVHAVCTDFDERAGDWRLLEANVHDPGRVAGHWVPFTRTAERAWRLVGVLGRASKQVRFDVLHAFWADANGVAAVLASRRLGVPLVASLGGGECTALPDISYGNARPLAAASRLKPCLRPPRRSPPEAARRVDWSRAGTWRLCRLERTARLRRPRGTTFRAAVEARSHRE